MHPLLECTLKPLNSHCRGGRVEIRKKCMGFWLGGFDPRGKGGGEEGGCICCYFLCSFVASIVFSLLLLLFALFTSAEPTARRPPRGKGRWGVGPSQNPMHLYSTLPPLQLEFSGFNVHSRRGCVVRAHVRPRMVLGFSL